MARNGRNDGPRSGDLTSREEELAVRWQAGDQDAATELYGILIHKARRVAYHDLAPRHRTPEMVHDAVAYTFTKLNKWSYTGEFLAWAGPVIRTFMWCEIRNRYKVKKRISPVNECSLDIAIEVPVSSVPEAARLELDSLLQPLPLHIRWAVVGHYMHGYSFDETALFVGCTPREAKRWAEYGMRILRGQRNGSRKYRRAKGESAAEDRATRALRVAQALIRESR